MPRSSFKRSAQPDDWQRLVAELAPEVVEAVDPADWQALEHRIIVWLRRRIGQFPWISTLALYAAVYSRTGAVAAYTKLAALHGFLRWAIPDHYPDIARLKPAEALELYFGDTPSWPAEGAYRFYATLDRYMEQHLAILSEVHAR